MPITNISTNIANDLINEAVVAVGGSLSRSDDGALVITVQFNEAMDTRAAFTPIISFPGATVGFIDSIAFDSGSFATTTFPNDTYAFTLDMLNENFDLDGIDITVSGARSAECGFPCRDSQRCL